MAIDYDLTIKKAFSDCLEYLNACKQKTKSSYSYSCLNCNIQSLKKISSNPKQFVNIHKRVKYAPIVSINEINPKFDQTLNNFLDKIDSYYSAEATKPEATKALVDSIESLHVVIDKCNLKTLWLDLVKPKRFLVKTR